MLNNSGYWIGPTAQGGCPEKPTSFGANLAAIWAQIQRFKSVNPNSYWIYEPPDLTKEPVLQNQIRNKPSLQKMKT